jgi:hypothetical protein
MKETAVRTGTPKLAKTPVRDERRQERDDERGLRRRPNAERCSRQREQCTTTSSQ